MVHITLYPPNSATPLEFDTENYGLKDNGVLCFRINDGLEAKDITTSVPFVVRNPVKKEENKPARSAQASGRGSGSPWT
jgi:hypothetical protein